MPADLTAWLGLTAVAAIVSTVGALLGILIKDYFFSRSFERWKQQQSIELLYQKYRDPLFLSARELASRIVELLNEYPANFLTQTVLDSRPPKQTANSNADPYFQRYKFVSTVYRFSAFFGWLELYRQETTFLQTADSEHSRRLETAIAKIRGDIADGHINEAEDWHRWHDILIFREELRAIGESMIETQGSSRAVMGYGRFVELFDSTSDSSTRRWTNVFVNFLIAPRAPYDFRAARLMRLIVHLVQLMELLGTAPIEKRVLEASQKWKDAACPLVSPALEKLTRRLTAHEP